MDPTGTRRRRSPSSFPRERGDGPKGDGISSVIPVFPPRARGWTDHEVGIDQYLPVSPASAGMDLRRGCGAARMSRFPRERGDGPPRMWRWTLPVSFPPRARGWTANSAANTVRGTVSPASAGMDPYAPSLLYPARRFPRERGDGPWRRSSASPEWGFPPRARGWTSRSPARILPKVVSPASAGMDHGGVIAESIDTRFPRERGDGPPSRTPPAGRFRFPPRARGWTAHRHRLEPRPRVSPASAGMDLSGVSIPGTKNRFPRERGDGPPRTAERSRGQGFPRERGDGPLRALPAGDQRIVSPASAGMDPAGRSTAAPSSRFPRERGDGPSLTRPPGAMKAFPPRARGWTASE